MEKDFWKNKALSEMTSEEWEALCDGCGKCCLNKLEDWDTGVILWTDIGCELLDCESCKCSDYKNRFAKVPDCIQLTPQKIESLGWLPPTCAYRLVAEGEDLYWWHPLISGDADTVHAAGISVRGRVVEDTGIPVEDYEDHLVDWPLEIYIEKLAEKNSKNRNLFLTPIRLRSTTLLRSEKCDQGQFLKLAIWKLHHTRQ